MYLPFEIQEMTASSGQGFDTAPSDSGALQSLTFPLGYKEVSSEESSEQMRG